MEWTELTKGNYLTAEQMTDIYNNFLYLKEKLEQLGYTVENLDDCSATKNINPSLIKGKFQSVEKNMQIIHNTAREWDFVYPGYYVWEKYNIDLKEKVWRWFDYLNEFYEELYVYSSTEALYDKYNIPILDINNEQIKVERNFLNGSI